MNGVGNGQAPLAGWAVVQSQGLTLIGRMHMSRPVLAPVFELKALMGQHGMGHLVLPVWLLGIDEFAIPDGAIVEHCESFSIKAREHLWQEVQNGQCLIDQMRAAESGVVLAPAGALRGIKGGKLP